MVNLDEWIIPLLPWKFLFAVHWLNENSQLLNINKRDHITHKYIPEKCPSFPIFKTLRSCIPSWKEDLCVSWILINYVLVFWILGFSIHCIQQFSDCLKTHRSFLLSCLCFFLLVSMIFLPHLLTAASVTMYPIRKSIENSQEKKFSFIDLLAGGFKTQISLIL